MSVDFFDCARCGNSVCRCGSWWTCEVCGIEICDDCQDTTGANNDEATARRNPGCPFCSRKEATDDQLLRFALKYFGINRKGLMRLYREAKGKAKEKKGSTS